MPVSKVRWPKTFAPVMSARLRLLLRLQLPRLPRLRLQLQLWLWPRLEAATVRMSNSSSLDQLNFICPFSSHSPFHTSRLQTLSQSARPPRLCNPLPQAISGSGSNCLSTTANALRAVVRLQMQLKQVFLCFPAKSPRA